jgi:predicted alpha/beta-hydrolase family hydrolase
MTLQRRRGKSPLAIESIEDRYCRRAAQCRSENATSRIRSGGDLLGIRVSISLSKDAIH